ncbi:MAG TPA: DUF6776 family protein [Steroidobacteraceae bacterium]
MTASDARTNLVVRAHSPLRRLILGAGLIIVGALAMYIVYELGRYNAGYDRLAVAQQRTELTVSIERLEKENRTLRTQLAELDTIRIGRAREQAEVARSIGDLQAQVARQAQELAFYRGIVAQGAAAIGVKIQQVRISPGAHSGAFVLHLAMVRSVRPDTVASGVMGITVDGVATDGKTVTVDLAALTDGKQREIPFNFRYFQNLDEQIALPQGFRPEHVAFELRSSRKDVAPATQTFPWDLDAA